MRDGDLALRGLDATTDLGDTRSTRLQRIASDALYAIAVELLLMAPICRRNLLDLRIGRELELDPRCGLPRRVRIAADKVKKQRPIEWP